MNIIFDYVICSTCKEHFTSREKLRSHYQSVHKEEHRILFIQEFDFLLPRCGSGHYYMNQLKCFFEANWVPCMKVLCYTMGFKSEVALKSAKRCADTHKAWKLLLIFYYGTLKEMVLQYILHAREHGVTDLSNKGFQHFYADHKSEDKLYNYYYEMVLRFAQSIINLMMAVRRNNAVLLQSAKYKFKELFHARHHPKYQAIEIYDTLYQVQAPAEVEHFLNVHSSASRSGSPYHGEDFDFILEAENRRTKRMCPPGVPTDEQWEVICRNATNLDELLSTFQALIGIKETQPCKSMDFILIAEKLS